jgi:hypothetical protein
LLLQYIATGTNHHLTRVVELSAKHHRPVLQLRDLLQAV